MSDALDLQGVSIVGVGYVGLVTGACLAARGIPVFCVDSDVPKLEMIRSGSSPIYEEGLDEILAATIGRSLHLTSNLQEAIDATNLTLIAVGTPSTDEGIDLTQIRGAVAAVGKAIARKGVFHAVVVKSTVVPGTTDTVVLEELERTTGGKAGVDFGLGVNPEFLTEGTAVADFMAPDRIVLGVDDDRTEVLLSQAYESFPDVEIIVTNSRTAEMIKYASNAVLATMISFSNELANLGAALGGIDTTEVMRGVLASRYVTTRVPGREDVTAGLASFLMAGCGFGGSCLPKDVTALVAEGARRGVPMRVLESVLEVNATQPRVLVDIVRRELGDLSQTTIGVLGLAFKPDTNDTRESPAFPVIRRLVQAGASVVAHDPIVRATEIPEDIRSSIRLRHDLSELLAEVDAAVLVTSWSQYRDLPAAIARLPAPPLVVDGRRFLEPASVPRYSGIGLR